MPPGHPIILLKSNFFAIYITLLLTVERWVAVVKPTRYNLIFKGKRLMGYVFFCWLWSFGLTGTNLFDVGYEPSSSSNDICKFNFISSGSTFRTSLSVFLIIMKLFFPCLSMIGLYVHMIVKTNNSPVASAESKAKLRGKMTRMIGIMTCINFTLMLFPKPNFLYLCNCG